MVAVLCLSFQSAATGERTESLTRDKERKTLFTFSRNVKSSSDRICLEDLSSEEGGILNGYQETPKGQVEEQTLEEARAP